MLLRFKYQPGEILRYQVKTNTIRETYQMDKVIEQQHQQVLTEVTIKCLNVEDDKAYVILSGEPKEFLLKGQTPEGSHIDYRASQEELAKSRYKVYITFDSRGRVLEMIGGSDVPALIFPEEEVQTGSTWKEEVKLNLPMVDEPISLELVYSVESVDGDKALISLESQEKNLNVPVSLTLESQERSFMADYLIRLHGRFEFDVSKGKLVGHNLNLDTTVKMDVYMVELKSSSELTLL